MWPHAKITLLYGHENPSSLGQWNPKHHIQPLKPKRGHIMEGSIAFGLQWSFLFQNSSITFLLHLAYIAFSLVSGTPKRKRVYSFSDVKQMRSENHGCYLPVCQLFPSLYLAQEANCPSATRVPMGLNVVRRTYFSGLRLILWRNIPFQLRPLRWLLHIKGSFIGASSNNSCVLLWVHTCLCPLRHPWSHLLFTRILAKSVFRQCSVWGRQLPPSVTSVFIQGLEP